MDLNLIRTCQWDHTNNYLFSLNQGPFALIRAQGANFQMRSISGELATSEGLVDGLKIYAGRVFVLVNFSDRDETAIIRVNPVTFGIVWQRTHKFRTQHKAVAVAAVPDINGL